MIGRRHQLQRLLIAGLLAGVLTSCTENLAERAVCEAGDGQVSLAWQALPGIDQYRVFRANDGMTAEPIGEVDGASFVDTGVQNGTRYGYIVRAVVPEGVEVPDVAACAVTPTASDSGELANVENLICRAKDGKVDLAWSSVIGASSYRVLRALGDGAFESIAESAEPIYADLAVTNGVSYRYELVALGEAGESEPSPVCEAMPKARDAGDPDAPPPVADLSCRAKSNKANLRWTAIAGATQYRVERTTGAGPFLAIGQTSEPVFADFGLYTGNSYDYRVVALGPTGLAAAPSAACAVTPGGRGGVAENRAPRIISTPVLLGLVGNAYAYDADASDADPNDVLRFALTSGPPGASIDAASGLLQWTPGALGAFAVEIEVSDGRGGSDRQSFTIGVSEPGVANARPIANAGADRVVDLEAGAETAVVQLDGSASTDADGYITNYAWSGAIDPGDVATPTVELPPGEHAFVLSVVDNAGTASATSNVLVQVRRKPSPPSISVTPPNATVAEGQTLVLDVQGSDPDGTVVTLGAFPALRNATFTSTPAVAAQGVFRFTPDQDQAGSYAMRFKARDATGLWVMQTVEITVTPGNRPPVLSVQPTAEVQAGNELVIGISASDPDLDPVQVTASGVPDNALFLPGTRSLIFQPATDQAGSYTVSFAASDGQANAPPQSVQITVTPPGDGETPLVLDVDPPASPNFAPSARITGRVNLEPGGESPIASTPLITGVSPANGVQGATLDVVLSGESTGPRAPNFVAGASSASFGDGITVESFTIESANRAVARIRVAPTATLGPRQITVTAGDETIESVLAFDVALGRARIEGRLVDEATGQPIAGAVVAIEGSAARTTTGLDGSFSFADVPAGTGNLLILPPNHAPIRREITSLPGQTLALEGLNSAATVFDPTAPASATLLSVFGRGITTAEPRIGREALKELITDTLLVVGGNESGALDEYDNQISTIVQGDGFVSVSDFGLGYIADQFQRGESFALTDLLLTLGMGLEWEGGPPLTITEWIDALQEQIDRAWANPAEPDSKYALVLFNRGERMLPEPPRISTMTRLNPLQTYLFTTSLLTYAFTADSDQFNSPSRFWRNFYQGRNAHIEGQIAQAQINGSNLAIYGSAGILLGAVEISLTRRFGTALFRPIGIGVGATTIGQQIAAAGVLYEEISRISAFARQDGRVPAPPIVAEARLDYAADGTERVVVEFERSQSEVTAAEFAYTLFRFDPNDDSARVVVDSKSSSDISLVFPEMVDPAPPRGTWFYSITATRLRSIDDAIPAGELEQLRPFWTDPLLAGADPANTLESVQRYTSDYSNAASVIVAPPLLLGDIPEIEPSPDGSRVYRSDTNGQTIWSHAIDGGGSVGAPTVFAASGFAAPGHRGLAVDRNDVVYTDNAASDSSYGGRLFGFFPPGALRDFVGTIQYFSRDLQFARPVLGGPMTVAPGTEVPSQSPEDLYVFDQLTNRILRVPVQATNWDPYRRNGKPYADIPSDLTGRALDIEPGPNGELHLLYATFGQPTLQSSLTAGPSIYHDGPLVERSGSGKGRNSAPPPTPTSPEGVASVLGRTQIRLNATVLDDAASPVSGAVVRFRASHGKLTESTAVTDSQGVASVNLEVELDALQQLTVRSIDIDAEIPGASEPLRSAIPVVDGVDELTRRYLEEAPVGRVITDGSFNSSLLRWVPIVGVRPGWMNNVLGDVINRDEYDPFICGNLQKRDLDWITRFVHTEPWLLNGIEFGPLQSLWGAHHTWAFWKKGQNYDRGWVPDAWTEQRPVVYTYAEWASAENLGAGPDFSTQRDKYPLTGSRYYPAVKEGPPRKIDFSFVGRMRGNAKMRLQAASGGVYDADAATYSLDESSHIHAGSLEFSLRESRVTADITGTEGGAFDLYVSDGAGAAYYPDVAIAAGETGRLELDLARPGDAIVFPDGRRVEPSGGYQLHALLVGFEPASAGVGETVAVTVTGSNTGFVAGVTSFDFGAGVDVASVDVRSPTEAVVTVTVTPEASGERLVTATTGARVAIARATFEVSQ